MTTNPGSFVGLLGVDQSVLILKKGNDIEQSTVFNELEKFNSIDRYNNEWRGTYDWRSYEDFNDAGAVIITNAKNQHGEILFSSYFEMFIIICTFFRSQNDVTIIKGMT